MDRRSLLTRATAALSVPLLGRYVITNPQAANGVTPGPELLVPETTPLVLATTMPARRVSGFSLYPDSWQVQIDRPVERMHDWSGREFLIASPATGTLSFKGRIGDLDDLTALDAAFRGNGNAKLRFYVEPV